MQHCYRFRNLQNIPTVLTIHNAQYQGWMGWESATYLPPYDSWKTGLLDWNGKINPLASAIRCASVVTTVSYSYLDELRQKSNGLEALFEYERGKCIGILNGIDAHVWNPASDSFIRHHYSAETAAQGKKQSKKELCDVFGLSPEKPLFVFIGRLVEEKAADLLPAVIGECFYHIGREMNFLVLGSGDPEVEGRLNGMMAYAQKDYSCYIGYNEALSHLMYAGADFLLMPSRVEPCGLNQLYAMRYGTVPIVRNTGGLRDTVRDVGDPDGYGILLNHAAVGDITHAVWRAMQVYRSTDYLSSIRQHMMRLDFSWENAVGNYLELYSRLT